MALCPSAATAQDGAERDAQRGLPPRAVVEVETNVTIEIDVPKSAACEATLSFRYSQRDTIARVEGTIENRACAASSGDYTFAINIRNERGELETLEFRETWQRTDDRPVPVAADYSIGTNVDLVSVRSRRLRCTCADPAAE